MHINFFAENFKSDWIALLSHELRKYVSKKHMFQINLLKKKALKWYMGHLNGWILKVDLKEMTLKTEDRTALVTLPFSSSFLIATHSVTKEGGCAT